MTLNGQAVLFSEMIPGPSLVDKFHNWYDTHHIPVRMACDGLVSAQRYSRQGDGGFLAVYEMDDIGVLTSDAYKVIKNKPSEKTAWMLTNVRGSSRYLGGETSVKPPVSTATDALMDAPMLYAVLFNIPT